MPGAVGWVAISAAVLAACNSTPKPIIQDQRIVGTWRVTANNAVVSFTETGIYTMRVPEIDRPVLGSYDWDPETSTLTLQTRRESPICSDDVGIYHVRLSALTLDAEVQRETCQVRKSLFSRPLDRAPLR